MKKLTIRGYLVLFLSCLSLAMVTDITANDVFAGQISYKLNTDKAQTEFYKNGTFTIKGLEVDIFNDGTYTGKGQPTLRSVPDLTKVGEQTVSVSLGNANLEYNIKVADNHPGDVLTLKDGSKWYYLDRTNGVTSLLSVQHLKQVCSGANCALALMQKDDFTKTFPSRPDGIMVGSITDPYDTVYKTKFNEVDASIDYQNSLIKEILDNDFSANYLERLASVVGESKIEGISIELPDAKLLTKVGGIQNWNAGLTSNSTIRFNQTASFLSGNKPTYWTSTKHLNNPAYAWVVNLSNGIWYGNTINWEFAIRPQINIPDKLLSEITINHDDTTDGEIDLVTAPNYIIYDVTNDKIIREVKSELSNGELDTFYPASLTKVTTVIVALELMEQQNISLDDTVIVDPYIDTYKETNPSVSYAGFSSGDVVTYRDLLYGALFPSGWDAVYQLSLSLAGSESALVEKMNEFVIRLLGEDAKTHYDNVSGLSYRYPNHVTTLEEQAKILAFAVTNPTFREIEANDKYTTTTGLSFSSPAYRNGFSDLDEYVAEKGGSTEYAGYNGMIYWHSDKGDYAVVVATDNNNVSKIMDLLSIYQWLFPGRIGGWDGVLPATDDDTDSNGEGILVPDTGFFTNDQQEKSVGQVAIILSLMTIITVLTIKGYKILSHQVKFEKK